MPLPRYGFRVTVLAKPLPGRELEPVTPEERKALEEKFGIDNLIDYSGTLLIRGYHHPGDMPDGLKMRFVMSRADGSREIEASINSLWGAF